MLAQPSCEQKAGLLGMRKNTLPRVHEVHRGHRAAFAGERIGECRQRRRELAGGEGVEGAEAGGEFGGGQAAFAVEPAEEITGGAFPFLRIAFETTRDEVAAGMPAPAGERHHVVEAPNQRSQPAQTIKAEAALPRVNRLAQCLGFQEIHLLKAGRVRLPGEAAGSDSIVMDPANLLGQTHLDDVTGFAAFHQAQCPLLDEAAHRFARGFIREPDTTGDPGNRKADA